MKQHINGRVQPWMAARIAAVMASTVSLLVLNTLPALTGLLARSLHYNAGTLGAFASALAASGITLVKLRAIGGLGSGLTLGACFVVFALGERERNFAAYSLGQTGLAVAVIAAIPAIANLLGWRGPFLGLAALVVPTLVLAHNLPTQMIISEYSRATGPSQRLIWFGIASVTLFFLGQGSLWTYLERIATASGIAEPLVNRALTVCAAFGFIAAIVVLWLGSRVTRASSMVASVLLNVVSAGLINTRYPCWRRFNVWTARMALSKYPVDALAITHNDRGDRFAASVSEVKSSLFGPTS